MVRTSYKKYKIMTGLRQLKTPVIIRYTKNNVQTVYQADMIYKLAMDKTNKVLFEPPYYVRDSQGNAYYKVRFIEDQSVYLYKSLGKSNAYVPVNKNYVRAHAILDVAKPSIVYDRLLDVKVVDGKIVSGSFITQIGVHKIVNSGSVIKLYSTSDLALQGDETLKWVKVNYEDNKFYENNAGANDNEKGLYKFNFISLTKDEADIRDKQSINHIVDENDTQIFDCK
jgi:hypothetical protein